MKILVLRRNSNTEEPSGIVGKSGRELAKRQGQIVANRGIGFDRLFYAPFLQTVETALLFCDGLDYIPTPMPVTAGLDYRALLAEMDLEKFKLAMDSGLSNFKAILDAHGEERAGRWADQARESVLFMFNQMEDGEAAVGFFPSPIIELAAWSCGVNPSVLNWDSIGPGEGLIFSFASPQKILVEDRADRQMGYGG